MGLVMFVVVYEGNGQIEWSPIVEDAMAALGAEYPAPDWSLWKDPGPENYTYRLRHRQGLLDEAAATAIADKIKGRWPMIRIVVFYTFEGNVNSQKVVR